MIILITRSEVKVKVTVTRKWYATLRHPKMHPHTKFGIPTSKNIGDMHRTRSGTDTRTDGAITICLPKFLWGHKNYVIMACLKSESVGKLINRIPGSGLLISSLPGSALRKHDEWLGKPAVSTSLLKVLPGKLDIKRHSYNLYNQRFFPAQLN